MEGTGLCGQNMFETLKGKPSNVASFFVVQFFFCFVLFRFCEEIVLLFIRRRFSKNLNINVAPLWYVKITLDTS